MLKDSPESGIRYNDSKVNSLWDSYEFMNKQLQNNDFEII